MGVSIVVSGSRACFTNPLLKMEKETYDCITPSAAEGILDAIYWHPAMKWVIDGITVLNPVKHASEMHNMLENQQCRTTFLKDVAYRIDAHPEPRLNAVPGTEAYNEKKALAIFNRRVRKHQCHHEPYLGLREYEAFFREPEDTDVSCFDGTGEVDLGLMFYGPWDEHGNFAPVFYPVKMRDGFVDVAAARDNGLLVRRRA